MKKNTLFGGDPIIKWDRVLCPACDEPTGPCSECYNIKQDKNVKKYLMTPMGGLQSIFSQSCPYRKKILWSCHINFPFCQEIYDKISKIKGVEAVEASNRYAFTISLGHTFDDLGIRTNITSLLKNFFKEMQSIESNSFGDMEPKVVGLVMPNGQSVILDEDQQSLLLEISELIDGVKIIKKESPEVEKPASGG